MFRRAIFSTNSEPVAGDDSFRPELAQTAGERLTPQIFSQVYETYFERVYNYFAYRQASREEAEDLTAQVFERLISRYHQYEPSKGSFESWLFRIARNALINQGRTRRRHPQAELDERLEDADLAGPVEQLLRQEELQRLRRYLGQLSERDRDLIALRYGAGLSQRQTGELLGMSETNVAVALGRALRRLRQRFEQEETI